MSVAPDDPTTPFPPENTSLSAPEESGMDIDPVEIRASTSATTAWLCADCDATVTTSKRYHQRILHQQSTTVVYKGQKKTVERNEDGTFHCLFCKETFKDPDKLKVWLNNCHR